MEGMRVAWVGVALVMLGASRARAQDAPPLETSISVESFQPASGPQSFATVEGAGVLPHLRTAAGALFHAASGGVTVFAVDAEDNLEKRQEVVRSQMWLDATFALGFKRRFQLGIVVPVLLSMQGDGIDAAANPATAEHLNQPALGDVRIDGKWLAAGGGDEVAVALAAAVTVPSSGGKDFVGEELPTFRPRVIVDDRFGKVSVAGNLGAVFRSPRTLFSSEHGQELTFGVAAGYDASKSLAIFGELFGRNGFSNDLDATPVEADAGIKVRRGSFVITLGGGAGVVRGVGAPDYRGFLGLAYVSPERHDTDGDGISDENEGLDYRDRTCAGAAEDKDGYEDDDGCPDPDNDGDDLLDDADKCPNSMEDVDGFEDADGCPDKDDDGDGVDDVKDACPGVKEDGAAPSAKDGCPASRGDADRDGVPDADDRCPEKAEDKDGFQDDDGCIDEDDDGDGAPDASDACRSAAEDKDGFDDEDGCPDIDYDGDGVLDACD